MAQASILIVSSAEDDESTGINNEFVAKLQQQMSEDTTIQWVNYHGLRAEMTAAGMRVVLVSEEKPLSDFDFVYFKSYFRYSEFAGVIAAYLENSATPFVCSELKHHIPLTKLTQLCRLSLAKLPFPDTVFMLNEEFARSFEMLKSKFGLPFIFKSIDGSGGDENYMICDEGQLNSALATHSDLKFIAQQFIPNDSDYRVLIVDSTIELVIKRQRADDTTHLNNTSQGAGAVLVPLTEIGAELQEMSLTAADVMQREIAGVDLMIDKNTGDPYILEVNASPQIGSGAFTDEKLDIYGKYFNNMVKYRNK